MTKYRLTERETFAPDYKYSEEFKKLTNAQARMRQMYHELAINGNPDAIQKAEINERSASVIINDGNEVYWDIEEIVTS